MGGSDWRSLERYENYRFMEVTNPAAGTYRIELHGETISVPSKIGIAFFARNFVDDMPPNPNPASWAVPPTATSTDTIMMVATEASDASPWEYFFEEVSGLFGGADSGWQTSSGYTNTGLASGTNYTYRVRIRDRSTYTNETGWSHPVSATTFNSVYSLGNDTPVQFTEPRTFSFLVEPHDWCGVAIAPLTNDYDLEAATWTNFSPPYAQSVGYHGTRDFIVVNGHRHSEAYLNYARTIYGSGTPYTIEAAWDIPDLGVNVIWGFSARTNDVLKMYEALLNAGQLYQVALTRTAGNVDHSLFVYDSESTIGIRADAAYTSTDGASGDESVVLRPAYTGSFAFAVINENAESGDYEMAVLDYLRMTNAAPLMRDTVPRNFEFWVPDRFWTAVALAPAVDHDVLVDSDPAFESVDKQSVFGGTTRDFVMVNGLLTSSWHYAKTYYGSGGDYGIEYVGSAWEQRGRAHRHVPCERCRGAGVSTGPDEQPRVSRRVVSRTATGMCRSSCQPRAALCLPERGGRQHRRRGSRR